MEEVISVDYRIESAGVVDVPGAAMRVALVYMQGKTAREPERLDRAVRMLLGRPGVARVEPTPATDVSVLMVHYDRQRTSGARIIKALRERGYRAALVGS